MVARYLSDLDAATRGQVVQSSGRSTGWARFLPRAELPVGCGHPEAGAGGGHDLGTVSGDGQLVAFIAEWLTEGSIVS